MAKHKFISDNYGVEKSLEVGQKVSCIYYHEYGGNPYPAYRRTFIEKLVDKPFSPVKFGVIVGTAGTHPFWLGRKGFEEYLLVKFKEYFFAKPIPISCIKDLKEDAVWRERFIASFAHKIGDKGYSIGAYYELNKLAERAKHLLSKS